MGELMSAHDKLLRWSKANLRKSQQGRLNYHITELIREVNDAAELALMRGRHRHLGEMHMLLSDLLSALSLCHRPIQREAAYSIVKDSLNRYLGIELPPLPAKRPRRKLLPHA